MCGIVGMAGFSLTARELTFFKQILVADEVRGVHSTGIARVTNEAGDPVVRMAKMALPASQFQYMPVHDVLTGYDAKLSVMLGHNRHATKGSASDPKGAHPFRHGHITLVHNGSLTTHYSLTKDNFTVDSEAICKAFEVDGAEAVIPKLSGAFALVWIDQKEKTLNFVRNSQRPFAIAWDETKKNIYWASELKMLDAYLSRSTSVMSDNSIHYDEIQELPVGEWWKFDISGGSADIKSVVKQEIKVHTPVVSQVGKPVTRTGTTTTKAGRGTTNPRHAAANCLNYGTDMEDRELDRARSEFVAKRIENIGKTFVGTRNFIEQCDDKGTYLEDPVGIYLIGFEPYSSTVNNTGTIEAQMIDFPYSKVIIYGCTRAKYEELTKEHLSLAQVFLSSINTPVKYRASLVLTEKALSEFELVGNQVTLRPLRIDDYDLYEFKLEFAPEEYTSMGALEAVLDEHFIDLSDDEDDIKGEVEEAPEEKK